MLTGGCTVRCNCWHSTEMQGGEAGALHKRRAGPFTRGWVSALYHRGTLEQTDMAENITFATLLFQKRALRLIPLKTLIFSINLNNLRRIDFCDRFCRRCHFQRLFMFTRSTWLPTDTCTPTDLSSRIECIYRL